MPSTVICGVSWAVANAARATMADASTTNVLMVVPVSSASVRKCKKGEDEQEGWGKVEESPGRQERPALNNQHTQSRTRRRPLPPYRALRNRAVMDGVKTKQKRERVSERERERVMH